MAQQKLVFGRDRDPGVVEEVVGRTKSGALASNPCVLFYGEGPEGRICFDCVHFFKQPGTAGTYYKCDLRRVTRGPASDHRARWPACARFEDRAPGEHGHP